MSAALAAPGVIGVFTASDLAAGNYGRALRDIPVLARDKVRFVGEKVAAVVAETRLEAEAAAALVEVSYEPLDAVTTMDAALLDDAPVIHERAWEYPGAGTTPDEPPNAVFHKAFGDRDAVERALAQAPYVVDETYELSSVHQGYLETQACVADYESPQRVRVWLCNKMPYRAREIVGAALDLDPEAIEFQSIVIGGDFGGKGSPHEAVACIELSRLTGRPVKVVLRYGEDLIAVNPRHPSEYRVQVGCDAEGRLVGASLEALFNGGAYGAFTPRGIAPHSGGVIASYKVPAFYSEVARVYTNTVPRGNMRAPGAPQSVFAFESALDELAIEAGFDPVEFRRENLLETGDHDTEHEQWIEHRGRETLDAALDAFVPIDPPQGWHYGTGVVVYSRAMSANVSTSMRLIPLEDDCIRVETPIIETGAGMHTALREIIADQLGFDVDQVEVVGVSTDSLPHDSGVGGSRVTGGLSTAVDIAAKNWRNRARDDETIVVGRRAGDGPQSRVVPRSDRPGRRRSRDRSVEDSRDHVGGRRRRDHQSTRPSDADRRGHGDGFRAGVP